MCLPLTKPSTSPHKTFSALDYVSLRYGRSTKCQRNPRHVQNVRTPVQQTLAENGVHSTQYSFCARKTRARGGGYIVDERAVVLVQFQAPDDGVLDRGAV